jgi:hypothetical protein
VPDTYGSHLGDGTTGSAATKRATSRATRPQGESGLTLTAVAGHQAADPPLGNPILAGHLRLAAALDNNGSDEKTSLRHQPNFGRSPYFDILRHAIHMS